MKSFNSPPKVVIIFLTIFIVLCCFLIVRLEIKAANLQSRLDEHHKSLEQNKDVLENLNSFTRKVKSNAIIVDEDKIKMSVDKQEFLLDKKDIILAANNDVKFVYNSDRDLLSMYNKNAQVTVGKVPYSNKHLDGVLIMSPKNANVIVVADKQILIGSREEGKISRINVDADYVNLERGESIVKLRDNELIIESLGDINITSKNGNVNIRGNKVKVNE